MALCLLLLLAFHAHEALASAMSTTTAYVVVTKTTSRDYYAGATSTITTTRTVKSYYSPTAQHPIATSTYTNTFQDLEVVQLYLAPGSIVEYKLVNDGGVGSGLNLGGDGGTSTYWVAPVTYTAPASCPTPFTVKTTATISLSASQTADVHPTSSATHTGILGPAVTLYLSAAPPGPAPTTGFDYSYYISECRQPPSSSGSDSGLDPDTEICLRRSICMTWRHWIIVLATVLPGLFVLGFIESFFWFRQLMRGRRAMRLGTLCWTLCSGWVLCFTRVTPARDVADQPALEEQWKAMSAGQKWRLWWKWGFRHRYPVDLLGPDPRKQMAGAGAVPAAKVEDVEEGVQEQPQVQQVHQAQQPTAAPLLPLLLQQGGEILIWFE
ncbi:hypothetical protein PG995_014778 [Apiospora arundinis]